MTERVVQIMEVITKNPGIKFREIMRATGLKNGVLSHHLGKMERSGTVQAVREPRQTRFYPLEISESESKIIKSLRRGTPRKILRSLMLNKEGLEFGEIVSESSKSPSTVSLYLSRMVDDGVVQVALENRKKRYFISERASVDRLIEDYHPGMLDAPAGGIEDIINVL